MSGEEEYVLAPIHATREGARALVDSVSEEISALLKQRGLAGAGLILGALYQTDDGMIRVYYGVDGYGDETVVQRIRTEFLKPPTAPATGPVS